MNWRRGVLRIWLSLSLAWIAVWALRMLDIENNRPPPPPGADLNSPMMALMWSPVGDYWTSGLLDPAFWLRTVLGPPVAVGIAAALIIWALEGFGSASKN